MAGTNYNLHDFEITLSNSGQYLVTVRPYLLQCVQHLANFYEMAIFTAAEQEYADLIIDLIDPNKEFF